MALWLDFIPPNSRYLGWKPDQQFEDSMGQNRAVLQGVQNTGEPPVPQFGQAEHVRSQDRIPQIERQRL